MAKKASLEPIYPKKGDPTAERLRRSVLRWGGIGQAVVIFVGFLGILSGIGIAVTEREEAGFITTTEHPFVWAGVMVVLGSVMLTVVLFTALAYMLWRAQESLERESVPLPPPL